MSNQENGMQKMPLSKMGLCRHDYGFIFHALNIHAEGLPPGAWFCNLNCGFYLLFNPEHAATKRPKVWKDMHWEAYNVHHWSNYGIAYTERPNPLKKVLPPINYKAGER